MWGAGAEREARSRVIRHGVNPRFIWPQTCQVFLHELDGRFKMSEDDRLQRYAMLSGRSLTTFQMC